MGKWSQALREEPVQEPQAQEKQGKWAGLLRAAEQQKISSYEHAPSDKRAPTMAEQDLPELASSGLLSGEDPATVAAISPVLLSATDPAEISQIIRARFPHVKQQQDEAGNEILYNPKTNVQTIVNKPGASKLDVLQGLGLVAAFSPAGGAAGLTTTTTGKVLAGSVAAGATEAGFQGLQKAIGGEFNVKDIGLSAALGGASELGAAGISGIKEARVAKRLRTEKEAIGEVSGEIAKAQRVTEKTGVEFFPGQKTLDPFSLEEQAYVASLPAAARKARLKLLQQNRQVGRAVDKFLVDIAPEKSVETAAGRIRDIAEQSITNASLARAKNVEPYFTEVWSQKNIINVKDIVDKVTDLSSEYGPGKIKGLLSSVKKSIEGAAEPVAGSNVRKLHNLKRELWAKISAFEREAPLNKEIKSTLKQLYGEVVEKLKKGVPGYEEAMQKYISETPSVEALTKGQIGKISKVKDVDLKSITGKIFDQAETNPAIIRQTRKVIKSQDPDAWNAIVRTEAQKRLKNIDLDIQNLTPDNAPAKIHRALFGSGQKRQIMLDALNKEQRANALFLEDALKRAAQGRPGGSQTGVRQVINEKLKGVGLAIRRFLANPVQRAIATGEESAFNKSASHMADVLFDTKWSPKVTKIRQAKYPEAERLMIELLKATPQAARTEQ